MTTELKASSKCPVCGIDTPHVHTRLSLARTYQEEKMQEMFEKHLDEWFGKYRTVLPGSYAMGIHLTNKTQHNVGAEYHWWPVQMAYEFFRRGIWFVKRPTPDGGVPDLQEALAIKADPFGLVTTQKDDALLEALKDLVDAISLSDFGYENFILESIWRARKIIKAATERAQDKGVR